MKSIYTDAVEFFGAENQLYKTVEELAELQQAIIKYNLSDRNDLQKTFVNLIEEIVDVEIMLSQIKTIFNSENEIELYNQFKNQKLEKLKKLIK
jgi:NTP pyrophosphatase (non-canonical NTP hydrolase)